MRSLTVLGSCGAWPEPGRACAGFLLEYDGHQVVLDLGYAALPHLLKHCPDGAVDAVIVTHQHPDHCVDVSALARVRYYQVPDASPNPLFCPPGVVDVLRALEHLGIKLTAPGLSVAYTGDSGPSPLLPKLAEGTDLYISDATLQGRRRPPRRAT